MLGVPCSRSRDWVPGALPWNWSQRVWFQGLAPRGWVLGPGLGTCTSLGSLWNLAP